MISKELKKALLEFHKRMLFYLIRIKEQHMTTHHLHHKIILIQKINITINIMEKIILNLINIGEICLMVIWIIFQYLYLKDLIKILIVLMHLKILIYNLVLLLFKWLNKYSGMLLKKIKKNLNKLKMGQIFHQINFI
jgi:hypothetical protein